MLGPYQNHPVLVEAISPKGRFGPAAHRSFIRSPATLARHVSQGEEWVSHGTGSGTTPR